MADLKKKDDAVVLSESGDATVAKTRLAQLQRQVEHGAKPARSRKTKSSDGPADWSDVLAEFDQVRKIAQTPRIDSTGYKRQIEAGKLWVRERIALLLDEGSFREIGSAAGTSTWRKTNPSSSNFIEAAKEGVEDFTPSNNVQG